MPIYEYQCQSCSRQTEALQRISDPPLETCDECGGALEKLISAPAFQFKGSGWYVTDYGKGTNGKGAAKTPSEDKAAESGKSDGGKGEGKSEGKGDGKSEGGSSSSTSSSKTGSGKSERIAANTDR